MGEKLKREIWFIGKRRVFWPSRLVPERVVHWKGYALYAALAAGLAFLTFVIPFGTMTWVLAILMFLGCGWVEHRHTEYRD